MPSDGLTLLDSRRNPDKEFFINFFEYCNLACGFCWQNHDDMTGFSTIVEKAAIVTEYMDANPGQRVVLNLMGGELFADSVNDTVVSRYYAFVDAVSHARSTGLIDLYWVTNLVTNQPSRAVSLVDYCRGKGHTSYLTASYDPKGRFTPATRKIFVENFFSLTEEGLIRTLSVVLTRPNIKTLLEHGDPFLQWVHDTDRCELYFDTYSPESNYAIYAPTDKELGDVLIWLSDHMPKSNPVAGMIERTQQPLSCRTSIIVHPSGAVGRCGSLVPSDLKEVMEVPIKILDNSDIESHSLKKYDCLSCSYYTVCGMGCFLLQNLRREDSSGECPYRRTFLHTERQSSRSDNQAARGV